MEEPGRKTMRIGVLASGGGSNLGAILTHLDALGAGARGSIVLVASDRASAHALDRARSRGIPAREIAESQRGAALMEMLERERVELVVLAGYLRLIPPDVIRAYRGRIINVHPALLPAFGGAGMYGIRAHRAVIASGARVSGVSVHFVDEEYDRGPLIAQWPVPVLPRDTPESLAARVLRVEHLLYPRVVDAIARGSITLTGDNRVQIEGGAINDDAMYILDANGSNAVARSMDAALG